MCWLYGERSTESCILGVKLCWSFICYAYKICTFYANLKHGKQVRIDWIPSLKCENVSHLGQNSLALYVYCRSNSGCKADLFSLPLFPHTRFSASASPSLSPAHLSVLGWPLRTAGECRPQPEQSVPITSVLLLLLPYSTSHLSAMPLSLHARRNLEGPGRILLTLLCWMSPVSQHLYPCQALPSPPGKSAPSLLSHPVTLL